MAIRNVPGSFATIQAAVNASSPFDTIVVAAGYAGNEFVNVTVNNLVFDAPTEIPRSNLTAAAGVTAITVTGNAGFRLTGNSQANTLTGGMGGDWFVGLGGNDTLNGGTGTDVVMYESAATGVVINLLTGRAKDGQGGNDTLTSIEAAHGSYFADTIRLSNSNGYAFGRAGNDEIVDGSGNSALYGGSGNDTLNGGAGIDTANYSVTTFDGGGDGDSGATVNLVTGTATDNWGNIDTLIGIENVTGSNLADSLTGDANRNVLVGNDGNDTLVGNAGNDDLIGGAGNDKLTGGIGLDYFRGDAGNDRFDGGEGFDFNWWSKSQDYDTVDYRFGPTTSVNVDLATGKASDGQGGTDTLINIESVYGSAFNDTLRGGGGARFESFRGGAGNDTIIGAGTKGTRAEYSDSTGGVTIKLTGAVDGRGSVKGGSTGTDTLRYVNQFIGSEHADTYDVSAYTLSMRDGGNGFNIFRGGGGNDTIIGNGNTRIEFGTATTGINIKLALTTVGDGQGGVDTFSGVNAVVGSAHADTMTGTDENETFAGGGGNDTIRGGGGFDEVRYGTSTSPITQGIKVDLKAGTVTGDATYVGSDKLSGVEGIQGSLLADTYVATGFAAGGATGTFRDGALVNVNHNRFAGLSGKDTIVGNGQTSLDYRGSNSAIAVTFTAQGQGTATGSADDTDTFTGVYSVIDTPFNDVLTGSNVAAVDYWEGFNLSAGDDIVNGGDGNDFISYSYALNLGVNLAFTGVGIGTATGNGIDSFTGIEFAFGSTKNDTMIGAGGNETFAGLAGDDKLNGGAGTADTVSYFYDSAGVSVDLGTGITKDGFGDSDTLAGFEIVVGSSFDDTIVGSDNVDTLMGGAGNDVLRGGLGKDVLDGGTGVDTADYVDKTVAVSVSLKGATNAVVKVNGVAEDTVRNIENVTGGSGRDTLTGDVLANTLSGGGGNDVLNGGEGNDVLIGGLGNDRFAFNTALNATNIDTVSGFNVVEDTIQLENAIFTALAGTGVLSAAQFVANASGIAADAAHRIVYETDTGKLFYDSNGSAAGGSVQFALLSTNLTLSNQDFLIV